MWLVLAHTVAMYCAIVVDSYKELRTVVTDWVSCSSQLNLRGEEV